MWTATANCATRPTLCRAAVLGLSLAGLQVFLQHRSQYQRHFNQAIKALKTQRMEAGQPASFRDALFEHLVVLADTHHQPLDIFRAHLEARAATQFPNYDPATVRSPKHVQQAQRLGLSNQALDYFRQAHPRRPREEAVSVIGAEALPAPMLAPVVFDTTPTSTSARRRRAGP
jgi:hypothetical protein